MTSTVHSYGTRQVSFVYWIGVVQKLVSTGVRYVLMRHGIWCRRRKHKTKVIVQVCSTALSRLVVVHRRFSGQMKDKDIKVDPFHHLDLDFYKPHGYPLTLRLRIWAYLIEIYF